MLTLHWTAVKPVYLLKFKCRTQKQRQEETILNSELLILRWWNMWSNRYLISSAYEHSSNNTNAHLKILTGCSLNCDECETCATNNILQWIPPFGIWCLMMASALHVFSTLLSCDIYLFLIHIFACRLVCVLVCWNNDFKSNYFSTRQIVEITKCNMNHNWA